MRTSFALLLMMIPTMPVFGAGDEGTVTWVDGKGAFEVRTVHQGVLLLHANADLMADKLAFKPKSFPHLYKELKVGDYISLDWHRDPESGKNIARFLGIKKRGG